MSIYLKGTTNIVWTGREERREEMGGVGNKEREGRSGEKILFLVYFKVEVL